MESKDPRNYFLCSQHELHRHLVGRKKCFHVRDFNAILMGLYTLLCQIFNWPRAGSFTHGKHSLGAF